MPIILGRYAEELFQCPPVGADAFKGREDWILWIPKQWYYDDNVDYSKIYATGWNVFKKFVFGSQLISIMPSIAEAGIISSDKKFYNAMEEMNLSVESVDPRYNFVGWFDRGQLISSELQASHKIVSLSPVEARFEPIPDAASDIVSVHIINGHLIVDIDLDATAGTYETTLYDSDGRELGTVRTQLTLSRTLSENAPSTPDFSNATDYSLIVYDNSNNKKAHYVGKVITDNPTTSIENFCVNLSEPDKYYNLQGLQVASPQKGKIYIVNRNGKYQKVMM